MRHKQPKILRLCVFPADVSHTGIVFQLFHVTLLPELGVVYPNQQTIAYRSRVVTSANHAPCPIRLPTGGSATAGHLPINCHRLLELPTVCPGVWLLVSS